MVRVQDEDDCLLAAHGLGVVEWVMNELVI